MPCVRVQPHGIGHFRCHAFFGYCTINLLPTRDTPSMYEYIPAMTSPDKLPQICLLTLVQCCPNLKVRGWVCSRPSYSLNRFIFPLILKQNNASRVILHMFRMNTHKLFQLRFEAMQRWYISGLWKIWLIFDDLREWKTIWAFGILVWIWSPQWFARVKNIAIMSIKGSFSSYFQTKHATAVAEDSEVRTAPNKET